MNYVLKVHLQMPAGIETAALLIAPESKVAERLMEILALSPRFGVLVCRTSMLEGELENFEVQEEADYRRCLDELARLVQPGGGSTH